MLRYFLIGIIQKSFTGKDGDLPKILIISPPTIGKLTKFKEMFEGVNLKVHKLAGDAGQSWNLLLCLNENTFIPKVDL